MRALDAGHVFELDHLDGDAKALLVFVKREGEAFPGNIGHFEGVITQEVLRVLIARTQYVDSQKHFSENDDVVHHLRFAIWLLESRAKRVRGETLMCAINGIEKKPTCKACGHLDCTAHR